MRKLFFYFLLAILLAISFSLLVDSDPGYVLIAIAGTTVETSLWIAILILALGFLGLYVLLLILSKVTGGHLFMRSFSPSYRRENRQLSGLVLCLEGEWKKGLKLLSKRGKTPESRLLANLMAAWVHSELGNHKESERCLLQAQQDSSRNKLLLLLIRSWLQRTSGQLEEAIATLTLANNKHPDNPMVLDMILSTQRQLKDWRGIAKTMDNLQIYRKGDTRLQNAQIKAAPLWFRNDSLPTDIKTDKQRLKIFHQRWQKLPVQVRQKSEVICSYVNALQQNDASQEAYEVLVEYLDQHWHPQAVLLFGTIYTGNTEQQLKQADLWLKKHPLDTNLFITLARLMTQRNQWDEAQNYLEKSTLTKENAIAYAELGLLLLPHNLSEDTIKHINNAIKMIAFQQAYSSVSPN